MNAAANFNEFVDKSSAAIRSALNTEKGQEITQLLLTEALKKNPNMTAEEWKDMKSEFMTFIFAQFVLNTPEAMKELADHVWTELNK